MNYLRNILDIKLKFIFFGMAWTLSSSENLLASSGGCGQALANLEISSSVFNNFLSDLALFKQLGAEQGSGSGFLIPNETDLGQHRLQFQSLSSGFYLSVGTERGFMSAAMHGANSEGLILVDRDPKVVVFNYYNRALLALAHSPTDYRYLRLEASFEIIQKRLKTVDSLQLSEHNKVVLQQHDLWKWWRLIHQMPSWKTFLINPESNQEGEFRGANYLYDDQLFKKISQLAKNNKIIIFNSRLENQNLVAQLEFVLAEHKSQIAVVDTSNAWSTGYIGPEETVKTLKRLTHLLRPKSHLIMTYLSQQRAQDNSSRFKFYFYDLQDKNIDFELPSLMAQLQQMESSLQKNTYSRRPHLFD